MRPEHRSPRASRPRSDVFESKLTAIGYGFLIPFFFIVSGMQFDLNALTSSATAMLKLPLFVALFLVVRGVPAFVLYHHVLDARDRLALGFFSSTQLALVVAITTIAIAAGKMRPSTSAALIAAGIISTLVFPLVGLDCGLAEPRTTWRTNRTSIPPLR